MQKMNNTKTVITEDEWIPALSKRIELEASNVSKEVKKLLVEMFGEENLVHIMNIKDIDNKTLVENIVVQILKRCVIENRPSDDIDIIKETTRNILVRLLCQFS